MPVEMLGPLRWRNRSYLLNPNTNGYRPDFWKAPPAPEEKTIEPGGASAQATCSIYDGDPYTYALREVKSYSEMMYPEVDVEKIVVEIPTIEAKAIQIKVPSGIIHQDTGVAV